MERGRVKIKNRDYWRYVRWSANPDQGSAAKPMFA